MKLETLKPRIATFGVRSTSFASPDRATRHQRGYGSEWDKTRARILKRDRYTCQIGKAQGNIHAGNTVDHIVNKAAGGSDADSNLQTVCATCHRVKTQREANAHR